MRASNPFNRLVPASGPVPCTPRSPARMRGALALLFVALAGLAACSDSPTEVRTVEVRVQVEFPASFVQSAAPNATVVLRSQETAQADTVISDAAGIAVFSSVVPGTYEISANRSLSAAESLQFTGIEEGVELNALLTSRQVSGTGPIEFTATLQGSAVGSWVISEMYYTGSPDFYFFDQFYRITNNSTDTLYAGGLMLASIHGVSGQINPSSEPTPFQNDQDHVYAAAIWRIPGGPDEHPVPPGGSLVIAQQGIDHRSDPDGNPNSPVDLGDADWEMYVDVPDSRDLDSPTVPNMEMVHRRFGFYALVPVFGPAIVLAEGDPDTFEAVTIPGDSPTSPPVIRIPVQNVIDGVEALQNENSGAFKRLPASIDAGFTFASGIYTAQAVRRRVQVETDDRIIYRDTNNSSSDFELVDNPTPRWP